VSVLMLIALVASATLVPATPRPDHRASVLDPLRALRHRSLATTSVVGLLYNWGFFTMLGYAPFLMGKVTAVQLGLVFFGWGVLVAVCAVFVAPRLKAWFGTPTTLYGNLVGMALVLLAIGLWRTHPAAVVVATIVSGVFVGVNNTLVTTAVMSIAPVPRPTASATYGFVRFIGGGLAPYVAGRIAEHAGGDARLAYLVAAGAVVVGALVLTTVHGALDAADREEEEPASAGRAADEAAPAAVPGVPEEAVIAEAALERDARVGR
jgi:MFS transporter, ACDE family, multidrug resistance protein